MAAISTATKGKLGAKAGKTALKNPAILRIGAQAARPVGKLSLKVGKPFAKLSAREQAERIGSAARTIGETIAVYGPEAAYELGLAERPKPKRTAPRVAAGVVIGASAVYFLEPEHGREHREKVAQLVS
jgi:hypothetical protein